MNEAKISDIFLSIQGEGPFAGTKQLFVRFYGCSFECSFCDTKPSTYETFSSDSLIDKISGFRDDYEHISITGGEPLIQADFLKNFLKSLKPAYKKPVYLETNGVLFGNLSEVIDFVDIVSVDFKLPTSTGIRPFWAEHEKFIEGCASKNTFVKAVVTDNTSISDIRKMGSIIAKSNRGMATILQPVTAIRGVRAPGPEKLFKFWKELIKILKDVRIIPQLHKLAGIK